MRGTIDGGGCCDVYWARLSSLRPRHVGLLDRDELARRSRYARDDDRRRFTLAAALLRVVVSARSGIPPERVEVDRTCPRCSQPHGRPRVFPPTEVSISHSGLFAAVAATTAGPVGVDVEQVRPVDYAPLLDDVCSPEERDTVTSPSAFYRYWTRKESLLKAAGVGLTVPMSELWVTPPTDSPRLLRYAGDGTIAARLADVSPTDGYVGAVTVLTGAAIRYSAHDAAPLLERV